MSGSNLKLTREVNSDGLTALCDASMLNSFGSSAGAGSGCHLCIYGDCRDWGQSGLEGQQIKPVG